MKGRLSLIISAAVLVLVAIVNWIVHLHLYGPLEISGDSYIVDIRSGDVSSVTVNKLAADGLLSQPFVYRAYLKISGRDRNMKAGEYQLAPGSSFIDLLDKIDRGEVILREVTLVEGWTIRQALKHLCAQSDITCTLNGDPGAVIPLIRTISASENPEGMIYPDTYRYSRGATDADIIKKANAQLLDVLEQAWKSRQKDFVLHSPYEALILASIVEKETSVPEERKKIAGVFIRRLQLGMKLQTDPTVIYGLGERYDGNLTRENLQDLTQYNTYRIDGLPPTPIAIVGSDAINAVMNPEQGTELYFVARGDGSHVFASTLEEHNRNVYQYQIKSKKKSGR